MYFPFLRDFILFGFAKQRDEATLEKGEDLNENDQEAGLKDYLQKLVMLFSLRE